MGHYLGPGLIKTGWMPCGCPPAEEAGLLGHRYWWCVQCDEGRPRCRSFCYVPPHVADMEPFRFVNRGVAGLPAGSAANGTGASPAGGS